MRTVAIIPAKGTSRRLTKKNIYPIWGKPMLYWAIQACKDSKYNIEPWVSTECEEVAAIAEKFGAKVHPRDTSMSDHMTYKQVVIRSAAEYILSQRATRWIDNKVDVFISLQPNSPEIKGADLDKGIDTLFKYNRDEVFSVDKDLMQNAAFRIFKEEYVFQQDLSTNCGVCVCDLHDVHTLKDIELLEK